MNKALWILQGLLAAIFLWHGSFMLVPPASMVDMINEQLGPAFRIFIGVSEVLAAIGLIAPGVTRIFPWLIPLAAAGLMIVMVSATGWHIVRAEYTSAISTAVILVFATLVAYLRWKVVPIAPRPLALKRVRTDQPVSSLHK